jgi:hypothetical protein
MYRHFKLVAPGGGEKVKLKGGGGKVKLKGGGKRR